MASYDFQTLSFSVTNTAILIINYQAALVSPYLLINNITTDLSDVITRTITVSTNSESGTESTTFKLAAINTGKTSANILNDTKVGSAIENLTDYESLRIVAAGSRIWKTSKNDNESGTVKAYYGQRGINISKSLKTLIDDTGINKNTAKVYVASDHCKCHSKPGFLIGGIYKPKDQDDLEDFN